MDTLEQALQKKSNNKELIKHISAIHCSNTLSLLQRKISNILLYHAYSQLLDREEHKISIKELCQYLGYKGYNYDVIKAALKALISTVIEWNLTDDRTGEEDWTASSILASVNIKKSICTYAYSPRMRQLLFSPSMYGKINLLIQSQFTSSYGLALYENCIRYQGLECTKELEINVFRKMMGVSNDKYVVFRDFKKRVIDKAVDEINTLTDLVVKPEIKRVGRKVTTIRFLLDKRQKKKRLQFDAKTDQMPNQAQSQEQENSDINENTTELLAKILEKLTKQYRMIPNKAKALIEKFGINSIDEKIVWMESSKSFLNGDIKNLAGYLINLLESNYSDTVSSQTVLDESRRAQDSEKITSRKQQYLTEKLRSEYSKYKIEQIWQAFLALDSNDRDKTIAKFKIELEDKKNSFAINRLVKNGIQDNIIQPIFCEYIQKQLPEILPNILDFESFHPQKA